ncbi:hypothetical protein P3W24_04055 [Luteibacter sp. PPL201]|uniref:Peptidase S74 domain-containing protein n=1 Tax=Luteibacter sahnii TaxID=3021977 RepID=A0ABT6B7S6_9GAMM
MSINRVNFNSLANGGDNPTAALVKLDGNDADLDSRVTANVASIAAANANANGRLPTANPTFTGMMSKAGVTNEFCFRISNVNSAQGIGGTFTDWSGNRTPALQVDCQLNTAAYCVSRATHWGVKHLWAADVYEGGSAGGAVTEYCFHFATGLQRHRFLDSGAMIIAGTLTQNSDYRIKGQVLDVEASAASAALRLLRPIEYTDTRLPADSPRMAGFIAHELQAHLPLLVVGQKDAVQETVEWQGDTTPYPPGEEPEDWVPPVQVTVETPVLQSVNYDRQVVYLTAGWQEHDQRIADLESKLAAALSRIESMEAQ